MANLRIYQRYNMNLLPADMDRVKQIAMIQQRSISDLMREAMADLIAKYPNPAAPLK